MTLSAVSESTLWTLQAITGTTAYTSPVITMDRMKAVSILLTTVSTATGTAKLQGSVDGTTFVDLANSGQTANLSVTAAGSYYWNLADIAFKQLRVVYTNATNSGTISGKWFAKQ